MCIYFRITLILLHPDVSFRLENDIFPYWACLDVPQTLLELSKSQGKPCAEVWSHITNGQLMALLGQKYFLPQKHSTCLAETYMDFFYRNSQSRQQSMQVLTKNTACDFSSSHKTSSHVHQMKIGANTNTNPNIIKHRSFQMELFLFWSLSQVFIKRSVYFQT